MASVDDRVDLIWLSLPAHELEPLLVFCRNAQLIRLLPVHDDRFQVIEVDLVVLWLLRDVVTREMTVLAFDAELL